MTDPGPRRTPRNLKPTATNNPAPTAQAPSSSRKKDTIPVPIALPASSQELPTPLPSSSTDDISQILPALAPTPAPIAPLASNTAPLPRTRTINDDEDEDDMSPVITIAPGISVAGQGKAPRFEGTAEMERSLASPATCSIVNDRVRAYVACQGLEDGKFMASLMPHFESKKMRNDITNTVSALGFTLKDLTLDQLDAVFRDTYLTGGQAALTNIFRAFKPEPGESPLSYYNRVDRGNYDVAVEDQSSQQEIITRVGANFSEDFAEFCLHHDSFATLRTHILPRVVEGDPVSLEAHRKAIVDYKKALDKAWVAYESHSKRVAAKVSDTVSNAISSAVAQALREHGIHDARKRGLSTASHTAQLPEPKRSYSSPALASNSAARYPPVTNQAWTRPRNAVNAIQAMNPNSRVAHDLSKHILALNKYHGCYNCFRINTNHDKNACPYTISGPIVPRYNLSAPAVMDILEDEVVNRGLRDCPLDQLEHILDQRLGYNTRAPAATGGNAVPVGAGRVHAIPTAHISPESSFEREDARGQVNAVHYTPNDMSALYAGTGLHGRHVVANVRSHMPPPPPPRRDTYESRDSSRGRTRVTAAFDRVDDWAQDAYDDDDHDEYMNQPAPRRSAETRHTRSRSHSRARDYDAPRPHSRASAGSHRRRSDTFADDRARPRSASPERLSGQRGRSPAAATRRRSRSSSRSGKGRDSSPLSSVPSSRNVSPPPVSPSPSPEARRGTRTEASADSPGRPRTLTDVPATSTRSTTRAAASTVKKVCSLRPLSPALSVRADGASHSSAHIPHILPHIRWKCFVGSPESSLMAPVRSLIDDGSPFVLIRAADVLKPLQSYL